MAKPRPRKTVQRNGTDRQSSSLPGWMYMLAGLAIGLTVAYAIYVNGNKAPPVKPADEAVSATPSKPAASKPAPAVVAEEPIAEEPVAEGEVTFDFYNMLPNLDVGLGEEQTAPETSAAPAAVAPPAVSKQGIYIIQAGSFSGIADANKRKAELGLLGIRSEIKAGDANGRTVYRVYTAPLTTPDDVNRTRSLLAGAGIEIMLKRVSD